MSEEVEFSGLMDRDDVTIGDAYEHATVEGGEISVGDILIVEEHRVPTTLSERNVKKRVYVEFVDAIIDKEFGGQPLVIGTGYAGQVKFANLQWVYGFEHGNRWEKRRDAYIYEPDGQLADEFDDGHFGTHYPELIDPFLNHYDEYLTVEYGEDINHIPDQDVRSEGK